MIRKKNKTDSCKNCGGSFEHYSYDSQEYCCKECYYESVRAKRPKVICISCGKEVEKYSSTVLRNENNYCSRECYDSRRAEDLKRLKRGTKYYLDLIHESSCECGEHEDYLLQVHHKDGNHNNNSPDNLEIVCANCHVKRHLKLDAKGRVVYHPKSLTTLEILNVINNA